jgi:hypothetical protein
MLRTRPPGRTLRCPCPMAISDMRPAARPLTLRKVYKKARSKQLHLTFRRDARD